MKKSKLFRLICLFTLSGLFFLVMFHNDLYADSLENGKSSMSIFPILMFDTDIGFGYGGKGKWLVNAEYRFPLWKKLGGNLLLDAGSVWTSFSEMFQSAVKVNAGWGLRYYLENFVVRFDMGFSQEGIGIYFNFGHIF
jgi:outer membrane protein assembly factor BamA